MNQPPTVDTAEAYRQFSTPTPDGATTSEERLLAGVAHLGLFGGMWLVAPLAIYFLKGKQSRFVGFHAVQACLWNVVAVPLSMMGMFFAFGGAFFGALFVDGHSSASAARVVVPLIVLAGLLGSGFLWIVVTIVAGVKALKGEAWSIPLIGRLARSVVDAK